jgi:hypothetical protein
MRKKRTTISLPTLRKGYYSSNIDPNKPYEPNFFAKGSQVIAVRNNSTQELRRAVHTLAVYFKREFSYDFTQFSIGNDDATAYLFLTPYTSIPEPVGAACFRFRDTKMEDETISPQWWFDWAWFHPYYRGKGILTEFLPIIKKHHPNCLLTYPLSRSMEEFDKKHKLDARHHDVEGTDKE